MGYMGLKCAGESDTASDFMDAITTTIAKKLKKEVKDKNNEFNTSGAVNCGFFVRDVIVPTVKHYKKKDFYIDSFLNDELIDALKKVKHRLSLEVTDSSPKNKDSWDSEKDRKEHFNCYKSLLQAVIYILNEWEDR